MSYEQRVLDAASADLIRGDDGFVVFWPSPGGGAFSAQHLRIIADEVDRRNEGWTDQIEAAFGEASKS